MTAPHLAPLRNRIIGRLRFSIHNLLHVGSGGEEARRELIKVRGEVINPSGEKLIESVVIPSSTIKGAFRNLAEWICKTMKISSVPECFRIADDRGLEVVNEEEAVSWLSKQPGLYDALVSLGFGDDLDRYGITSPDELPQKLESIPKSLRVEMAKRYATIFHPLYRLFGGQSLAAKLRFLDIFVPCRLTEKPGVAIDRKSGKVLERHLFFLESLAQQYVDIWFVADNLLPGEEDSKLFAFTLEAIQNTGLWLGARKSAGMGWLKLEGGQVWVIETEGDMSGEVLANPWKNGIKKDLSAFLQYLTPEAT